jgi:glycerol uptake facilitator-like aquaporin
LVIALSVYLLMSASRAGNEAFASLWFLAVLPAYLCALICYVGDPAGTRSSNFYLSVPPILVGLVIIGSAAFLGKASSAWSCCPRSG